MAKPEQWDAILIQPVPFKASAPTEGAEGGGALSPDGQMIIWTWVTFGLLCLILWKFAWKPILDALDKREGNIRQAVEDAEAVRQEREAIEEQRRDILASADTKAKDIVGTARKAAVEASRVIEEKAREEAQIMMENAEREIKTAKSRAESELRRESAELAVSLASKVLQEKLDDANSKALVDKLIKEMN